MRNGPSPVNDALGHISSGVVQMFPWPPTQHFKEESDNRGRNEKAVDDEHALKVAQMERL